MSGLEGDSGTTNFVFDVTLSAAYPLTVTVDYATADNTATLADNDYTANSGTLTFPAGATSETVTVQVVGDTIFEGSEAFRVNLSNPVNASIGDGVAVGTILNDDVRIFINNVSSVEGNSGTTNFVFDVTLSAAYPLTVTVDYATADNTATLADNDYTANSGTLTFPAGATSETVTVQVVGDTIFEGSEAFRVNLSNPVNASIGDGVAVGTILNDDT